MALTLQLAILVAVLAAVWQHASANKAFSYSRQSVSGPPVVGPAQKIAVPGAHGQGQESYDYVAHPQYRNAYEVSDPQTGDFHMHEEQREGEAVKGSYRVHDADGRVRTVHYTADEGGYRAEVTYSSPGAPHAPAPARGPAPAHAPAPVEVHHQQQVRVQPQIPSPPVHSLPPVGGQSHSHTNIEGHSHSLSHSQVHDVARPAPVHSQQLHQGLAHRPLQPQGRGLRAEQLKHHRAQLLKHQQRVQHHAQGLEHAQQLAEAQGLTHLQ